MGDSGQGARRVGRGVLAVLRRVGLAVLGGATLFGVVDTAVGASPLPTTGAEWFLSALGFLGLAVPVVWLVAVEARARCLRWRWWLAAAVLAPWAAPLVLLLVRGPRVGGRPAAPLVDEFGVLFDELVEAETRRRLDQGLPLSGMAIAQVAAGGARTAVMLQHRLTPDDAERVAELYARRVR